MDAKDRLRLYLEQRRELGESDLTLDELPVADVLSILGARGSATTSKQGVDPRGAVAVPTPTVSRPPAKPSPAAPTAPEQAPSAGDGPGTAKPSSPPPATAPEIAARPNAPAAPAAGSDWRTVLGAAQEQAPENSAPTTPRPPVPPSRDEVPAWLTALGVPLGITAGGSLTATGGAPAAVEDSLEAIAKTAAGCTACALHGSATQAVPGEGNPLADFVCVGEAPGQTEDETGRPFVGAAGQLLTKILAAIELPREEVFICNVLKHRPPGNRNPLPDEVAACRPFLERQLSVLKPRVILALGTFAAQTLLDSTESLGKLRGRIHRYHGIPLVVTYHPAALLRNAAWKRPTWEDVQLARRVQDASRAASAA